MDRSWRRGRLALDLAFCAVLLAFNVSVTTSDTRAGAGTVWDTLLLPTLLLPFLLRRRAPFAAAAGLAAACVVSGIPTFDQFRLAMAIPASLPILFELATREPRPRALGGLAFVLAGMVFVGLTDVVVADQGGVAGMIVFSFPLCIAIWMAGRVVRSRDLVAAELAERSRLLELQREQTAQLAVEVERTRLASDLDAAARVHLRELMDLAETGERSLVADPEGAQEAFSRIERMGREALNEMRGLLGVLRSDERGERSSNPTLAQIETLLEEARAGGRLVDLEVDGERRPLAGGVELAAYRALQHALVAVRGAEGEPAVVRLRYAADALELEVRGFATEGSDAQAAVMAARERVTAHGGSFSADSAHGRRALRAQLPLVADGG